MISRVNLSLPSVKPWQTKLFFSITFPVFVFALLLLVDHQPSVVMRSTAEYDMNAAELQNAQPSEMLSAESIHGTSPGEQITEAVPPSLSVVGTYPLPGERLQDRFIFYFDQPLQISPEVKEIPFTITPHLIGTPVFGERYIAYQIQPSEQHSVYTVRLHEGIRSVQGQALAEEQREWTFYKNTNLIIERLASERQNERQILARAQFSMPVNPDSVRERVTAVDAHSEQIPVRVQVTDNPAVVLLDVQQEKLDYPVTITIQSGFVDVTGQFTSTHSLSQTYRWHANLYVNAVRWTEVRDDRQVFEIHFSHPVKAADLQNHLQIRKVPGGEPVNYTIITSIYTQPVHRMEIEPQSLQNLKLEVTVTRNLKGGEQEILVEDSRHSLQYEIPPLSIEDTWWTYEEQRTAALSLWFNFNLTPHVSVEEMQKHIEIIPPINRMEVRFNSWNNRSVLITGDWLPEHPYQVRVLQGLRYHPHAALEQTLERDIKSERIQPYVGFKLEGKYYFLRRTGMKLPVETRGINQLQVSLYKLFPSNLVYALKELGGSESNTYFAEQWCEIIKSVTIPVSAPAHQLTQTLLNMDDLFPPNKQGVYCVTASDGEYQNSAKIVLYTDMGILAHWQDDELVVFVHDLFTLEPKEYARVQVYSHKSQLIGEAFTDSKGMFQFKNFDTSKGNPKTLVVDHGNDFTFMELQHRYENTAAMKDDMPVFNKMEYDAFLYADRDLYRPGETVHLRWVVRQNYGDALGNIPLLFKIFKPNGQELHSEPTTLSALGTGGKDLVTQKTYPTGQYEAQLLVPGSEQPIGRYSFKVEEFVPQRMKTEVNLTEKIWQTGQEYLIKLQANHLFGTPASDRKSEVQVYFQKTEFAPPGWENYTFTNDSDYIPESLSLGEQQTDQVGSATFTFQYTPTEELTFPLKAIVIGDVFELGGRAVTGRADAIFVPDETLLGVALNTSQVGDELQVHAAAVRADGTAADLQEVTLTLERETWSYYVRRYYSHNDPNWSKAYQEISSRQITLENGRGSLTLPISGYGNYRIRLHNEETRQYAALSFYRYGGRSFVRKESQPDLVKLTPDKEEYQVGEQATVRLESPFNGHGIVVLQNESFQRIFPVTIENNEAEITLALTEEHYPNLWVEVTVIHPYKKDQPQLYPFSSFTMASLRVNHPGRKLMVEFPALPEEIRPETTHEFHLQVHDHAGNPVQAEITLAAVDEGIHAITNYQSPKPYEWFARERKPDFRRSHYYDRVVYDFESLLPGGDGIVDLSTMLTTPLDNWIKPVALWSGVVASDENGSATVSLTIPEYNGQLRLVAVAVTKQAVGAKERNIYVRQPYMLRVSLPRFLLPDDKMQSRVVLFNNSQENVEAVLSWEAGGALQAATGETRISIPAQGEANFAAEFVAEEVIGQGTVSWFARIIDQDGNAIEQLAEAAPLPVLPPVSYQSRHELRVMQPGEEVVLNASGFIPDPRTKLEITLAANPALRIRDALEFLIGYPYGCLEQTTSRLMPLYVLRQNQDLLDTALKDTRVDEFIRAGIDRLFAMQTVSGGLGFWSGAIDPHPYGSVYAFHFLTLIKNGRDYPLPERNYNALKQYVQALASDWNQTDLSSLFLRTYAIYTLALAGETSAIQQIQRFDNLQIPIASRYLLAAILSPSTGNMERVQYYLNDAPQVAFTAEEQGNVLNSPIRNQAIRLLALLNLKGQEQKQAELAEELVHFLELNRHGNTQETAFIVTALGQYLERLAQNQEAAAVEIASSSETLQLTGSKIYQDVIRGINPSFRVKNTGQTNIYVSLTSRGIPQDVTRTAVAQGIRIERNFLAGKKPHEGAFKQGELYVIDVRLQLENNLENVVVADLLPAGLEVENPRLNPDTLPESSFKGAVVPSHLDVRDDRVIFAFNELSSGEHHFYYTVRAITPGTFEYPPVHAECMYDPQVFGTSAAGTMVVEE